MPRSNPGAVFSRLGLLFAFTPIFTLAASAQTPPPDPAAPALHYDVVSIRESKPDTSGMIYVSSKGDAHSSRKDYENFPYMQLVADAFGIPFYQLDPLPPGVDTHAFFNLHLSGSEETDAALKAMTDKEAFTAHGPMLQEVLADRFHLQYHWVTRDMPSYILAVGKANKMRVSVIKPPAPGEKLRYDAKDPTAAWINTRVSQQGFILEARGISMAQVAGQLAYSLHGPVVDHTGLTGLWDFTLNYYYNPQVQASADDTHYPPIEAALADQLGLKVEHGKAPLKILIVDHIEPPTPN